MKNSLTEKIFEMLSLVLKSLGLESTIARGWRFGQSSVRLWLKSD